MPERIVGGRFEIKKNPEADIPGRGDEGGFHEYPESPPLRADTP
jgi:hypothetical protein